MKVWRKKEKKEKKKEEGKIPRWLQLMIDSSHRWAGVVAGPPGTGKTTFMRMLARYVDVILLTVKEDHLPMTSLCVPEEHVVRRISGVLHFTVEGLRPSFDALVSFEAKSIDELENLLGRLRSDIAEWIAVRLRILKKWANNGCIEVPLHQRYDELERRLAIGVLYVSRSLFPKPLLLDDALAFVVNQPYFDAFNAMMRPYIFAINRYLDSRELLRYNPIIITPGGAGVSAGPRGGLHRLARRDKYVIIMDGKLFEVPIRDVQRLSQ